MYAVHWLAKTMHFTQTQTPSFNSIQLRLACAPTLIQFGWLGFASSAIQLDSATLLSKLG